MTYRFRLLVALLFVMTGAPLAAKPAKQRDLYDTIAANPIMTNFASMLQASDLGTFLSSRGPFTVFVPTDSAFAKLPPGTLETLLRPENSERLKDIVLFHVINNKKFTAKDIVPLRAYFSCEGNPLLFRTLHAGTQYVMKAKIVHADIRCSNGILHEVDTVLMPPELALPKIAPPPPPNAVPATNAPPANTNGATNAAPIDPGTVPVSPVAKPADVSP